MTKNIIACIDGSASAPAVCDWATWASVQLKAPLTLLHTLDKPTRAEHTDLSGAIGLGAREDLLEELTRLDEQREKVALLHGKEMLAGAKARAENNGAFQVESRQRHGDLVDTLVELEPSTRLLVMGRQGEHSQRQIRQIGSHLESVIRSVHCPVLVVTSVFRPPRSFIMAYDGSATAQAALVRVTESPLLQSLICHLVMVGDDFQGKLKKAASLLTSAGFPTDVRSLPGDNVSVLGDYARLNDIDLMIMGAHGHSRIRQFFIGSNTATLLRAASTPLLILR